MNTENTTMADLTMSQFASKDDLIAAQAVRIAELEAEVDAERRHHGIRNASAVRTLHALGYSWRGTDAWQPPAEQGKCLHQIAEPTQVVEAQDLYYLKDARHHAMVGNCPSFWREGGGYTTNLDEAERFTLEAAMKQHKCRETDLPWLCTEVDKVRRPTVDCQFMPRSWGAQRSALAAQAKQGGAA
jgi:hypothetical protein